MPEILLVFCSSALGQIGAGIGAQTSVSASLGASFSCFTLYLIFFSSLLPSPAFVLSSSFPPSLSCVKSELKKCQSGAGQRNLFPLSSTFLHCLSPPLLACISGSALERDAFSQRADTKRLGVILPCSCSLPLPAQGASIVDPVSARQVVSTLWWRWWCWGG